MSHYRQSNSAATFIWKGFCSFRQFLREVYFDTSYTRLFESKKIKKVERLLNLSALRRRLRLLERFLLFYNQEREATESLDEKKREGNSEIYTHPIQVWR